MFSVLDFLNFFKGATKEMQKEKYIIAIKFKLTTL